MSAFQNITQRLDKNARLNAARRRGRGQLSGLPFLKHVRPQNIAAVVLPQAPLPAGSIALPPPDDVQSRQWSSYVQGRPTEPVELEHCDGIIPELDVLPTLTRLSEPCSRNIVEACSRDHYVELDAPRASYQSIGEPNSIHSLSPVSPLSQATNAPGSRDSTTTGSGSCNGTIFELDASSQELHQLNGRPDSFHCRSAISSLSQLTKASKSRDSTATGSGSHDSTAFELDTSGRDISRVERQRASRDPGSLPWLLEIDPLPQTTDQSRGQFTLSPTEYTQEDIMKASTVEQPHPSGVKAMPNRSPARKNPFLTGVFDCPIRAGPNGTNLCTWPSRPDISGFPSLARMREHVGSHGLLCPDCDKLFFKPTRYKDHRNNKAQTGKYSETGEDKSGCPKHLTHSPDVILAFFRRHDSKMSEQDAWHNGYKILHPNWELDGRLPHPFYTRNIDSNRSPLILRAVCNDHDTGIQSSGSSGSYAVSSEQSTHHSIGHFTGDGVEPNTGRSDQRLAYDTSDDPKFTQMLQDLTWINDPSNHQHSTNSIFEDLMMSGGLSDSGEILDKDHVERAGQAGGTSGTFGLVEREIQGSDVIGVRDGVLEQPHTLDHQMLDLSSQVFLSTTIQSSEAPSWDDREAGVHQANRNDSGMQLCEGDINTYHETGQLRKNSPPEFAATSSRGQEPARPLATNSPARRNALKRNEERVRRRMAHCEQVLRNVRRLQSENRSLQSEKQSLLQSENRLLQAKIRSVEDEKENLLRTLRLIREEVEACDIRNDGETPQLDEHLDSLSQSMQEIKLLVADAIYDWQ